MNAKLRLAAKAAVVASLAITERVRPPRATRREDVPCSGAKLTREWLADSLCHGVPDADVVAFSPSGGSSGTSERVGLRVTYNDAGTAAGLPADVYTKSTASFRQRMALGGAGILRGEPRFYTALRDKVEIEAPRGYWGAVDDRSWRSIVLVEDIAATKGAEFLEPTTGFTQAEMTDLVRNLARLHGPYWNSPELAPLHTPAEYRARTHEMLNFAKRAAVGMERARAVIPAALLGQADRLHRATIRAMEISTSAMPRTLVHGDCHAGQIYRTRDGAMGIADWQTVMQGGWSHDYTYLVNTGLEPADRRAWQDDLLRAYLDELSLHGGPVLVFDEAFLAYRQQSFWPYTAWAFTIGRAFYHPKMQPVPTCLALVHRTSTAIDDLDAFAAVGV